MNRLLSLLLPVLALAGCATADEGPPVGSVDAAEADTAGPVNELPEETVCTDALARIAECGFTPDETPYPWIDDGGDSCFRACEAECIAAAGCWELDVGAVEIWEDEVCTYVSGRTGSCVTGCLDCMTPLVLSFDGGPVLLAPSAGTFDFGGGPALSDWPAASTPWLALDRDGDGAITSARELFGSATPLAAGGVGANGFVPLAELDADGDGDVDARDPAWTALRLWADADADRRSTPEELRGLDAAVVTRLGLTTTLEPHCDARGNCEGERAPFRWRTPAGVAREGAIVDVYLRTRPVATAAR